jgi:hypothetical protein
MAHLRWVILALIVPTWYDKPPGAYGARSAGTLKAAQWRSMIELYLPIALATIWHPESPMRDVSAPAHAWSAFENVMHLSQAVLLCYKENMSSQRAMRFRDHYTKFVKTLTSEPLGSYNERLVPNIHAAFHIYDSLITIGPSRVAHCLPFERLIGLLQRQNTNHKPGGICIGASVTCA